MALVSIIRCRSKGASTASVQIRDRPISPRSPWQNPYAERLIGTLRRDCLDHVLIFSARHLRLILAAYSVYYNRTRTHLSLDKDAPFGRAIQRHGVIVSVPILSGFASGKNHPGNQRPGPLLDNVLDKNVHALPRSL